MVVKGLDSPPQDYSIIWCSFACLYAFILEFYGWVWYWIFVFFNTSSVKDDILEFKDFSLRIGFGKVISHYVLVFEKWFLITYWFWKSVFLLRIGFEKVLLKYSSKLLASGGERSSTFNVGATRPISLRLTWALVSFYVFHVYMSWFNFKSKLKEVEGIIPVGCFITWKLGLRLRIGFVHDFHVMPVSEAVIHIVHLTLSCYIARLSYMHAW